MACIGRFAPSPTGRMHAGNIFASLVQWLVVKSRGGRIVLRIEDLDRDRSKPGFIDAIPRDYERLGLFWDEGPVYQSDRDDIYEGYYAQLDERGLLYPCFCTRADLLSASAPHRGEKTVYSGRCRNMDETARQKASESRKPAIRVMVPDEMYSLDDGFQGEYRQNLAGDCGDFIVRRSDGGFAYQLAVVADDGLQGVTDIVRGVDLLCSTPQQLYLQDLFGFPHPSYWHVPLLTAREGVRLSKRNRDASLDEMLAVLGSPEGVIGYIARVTGLIGEFRPATPEELLTEFDPERLRTRWMGEIQIPWIPPERPMK